MHNPIVAKFCLTTISVLSSVILPSEPAEAATSVEARLSTKDAYVGQPILMQIIVRDAESFMAPEPPVIDGLSIQSAGPESTSMQTTIINGLTTTSQTAILSYRVIPKRTGIFTIPEIPIDVNGVQLPTTPLQFSATISETGDLLFAEISCKHDKVYVGQSVGLTLKFWVKPYYDTEFDFTFGEKEMWELLAEQTDWGPFTEAIEQLSSQRQRPGGREVTRDNGKGQSERYLLYEIDATHVPSRPGPLANDEVKVVLDYPTKLGRARDPMADFFQGSPFGASPLSRLFDEESGPHTGRLKIVGSRPISATPENEPLKVIPVPSAGRPASYRGAVGDFSIRARATIHQVAVGDPIEMTIAISGSGALDLVQPPPISEQSNLTSDFKVSDQPIGGYVKDDTKYFGTSIRPLNEKAREIPAIEFSFFDPETESFRTVASDPIPIEVEVAETLSLPSYDPNPATNPQPSNAPAKLGSDWSHDLPLERLLAKPTAPGQHTTAGLIAALLPPLTWMAFILFVNRHRLMETLARRKPLLTAEREIFFAESPSQIIEALVRYVDRRFGSTTTSSASGIVAAAGRLRLAGHYNQAAELESLADSTAIEIPLEVVRDKARQWLQAAENSRRYRGSLRVNAAAILAMCFLMPTSLAAESLAGINAIKQAQNNYASGEFAAATEQYQLAIESGIDNALVRRCIADAQFRSGQVPDAIANYTAAQFYDPRDTTTLERLESVCQTLAPMTINGQTVYPTSPVWSWEDYWDFWTANPNFILPLVFANLIGWAWVIGRTVFRKRYLGSMISALCVTAILLSVLWTLDHRETVAQVVFASNDITVRSGDGEGFESVAQLATASGHTASWIDQRAGWVQLELAGGIIGWVQANKVLPTLPASHRPFPS